MKALLLVVACLGLCVGGCGGASAEGQSALRSSKGAARAKQPMAVAASRVLPPQGIAGCDATLAMDFQRISDAPGVRDQLSAMWDLLELRLDSEPKAAAARRDLARLGVRDLNDITAIEVCVPESGEIDLDDRIERSGVVIHGNFTPGALIPLVMKWARTKIELEEYRGQTVLRINDEGLVAQRADGDIVIAAHPSALGRLMDAPGYAARPGLALSGYVKHARNMWSSRNAKRKPFPTEAVQSISFDLGPNVDRFRLTVRADDASAAAKVASALRASVADLSDDRRASREGAALDALIVAAQMAPIKQDGRDVTLDVQLPSMWPALSIHELIRGIL